MDLDKERRIKRIIGEIKEMMDNNPALADRTGKMLQGEIPCSELEEPMTPKEDTSTSIRLSRELQARADALMEKIKDRPEVTAFGRVTRSSVLRLALVKGLEILEKEAS